VERNSRHEPYTGKTARERFGNTARSRAALAVTSTWIPWASRSRTTTQSGSIEAPNTPRSTVSPTNADRRERLRSRRAGTASGPVELVRLLASSEEMQTCFATNWMQFAYGRVLDEQDDCNEQSVQTAFKSADFKVKQLLLALTQTDAFQYLSTTSATP
jgi:hypothetical protein